MSFWNKKKEPQPINITLKLEPLPVNMNLKAEPISIDLQREKVETVEIHNEIIEIHSEAINLKEKPLVLMTSYPDFKSKKLLKVLIVSRKAPDMKEPDRAIPRDFTISEIIGDIEAECYRVDASNNLADRLNSDFNLDYNLALPQGHEIKLIVNKTQKDVWAQVWIIMMLEG